MSDSVHSSHSSPGGLGKYIAVFFTLCFLTLCSFWTYSDLWPKSLDQDATKRVFMMAVSCMKALLVVLFFMHLLWEANWKWVLTIPASLMSVFLILMLVPDVGLRMRKASEERLLHAAEPAAPAAEASAAKKEVDGHS